MTDEANALISEERYFRRLATAYVRGKASQSEAWPGGDQELLSTAERQVNQPLSAFKRTMGLARVDRVLGILRGIAPENLLDIGPGRGAYLWPLLDVFQELRVHCVDLRASSVERIETIRRGGIPNVSAEIMDATNLTFGDGSFDVVTALEVLEHIRDYSCAVRELVRVARRFVVFSVPSKSDDNPRHLRLFTPAELQSVFQDAGAISVKIDYVPNHTVGIARCYS